MHYAVYTVNFLQILHRENVELDASGPAKRYQGDNAVKAGDLLNHLTVHVLPPVQNSIRHCTVRQYHRKSRADFFMGVFAAGSAQ
jgi:hypothetical protein